VEADRISDCSSAAGMTNTIAWWVVDGAMVELDNVQLYCLSSWAQSRRLRGACMETSWLLYHTLLKASANALRAVVAMILESAHRSNHP
jgi:hypothetical protein